MIKLLRGLVITADEHCFIVGKPRQKADKRVWIENPKYYPTIEQAVQAAVVRIMRQSVADGDVTTLHQFIEEQERLHEELKTLIAPLDVGKPRQRVDNDLFTDRVCKDIPEHKKACAGDLSGEIRKEE